MHPDFDLDSYTYDLPEDLIAQFPADRRDESRLLVLDRKSGNIRHETFSGLLEFLPRNALVVANNTRVIPARLIGRKPTGGRVEFLLTTPLPLIKISGPDPGGFFLGEVEALLRASKGPRPGDVIELGPDMRFEVKTRGEYGRCTGVLFWKGDLAERLHQTGRVPLPPYIRRQDAGVDRDRYQTVYAAPGKPGAVAAPTAGLHFTPELIAGLEQAGLEWTEITLYVGYGTFSPIRERDIRNHEMHAEYYEISDEAGAYINVAIDEGRPVVAVGTTTVRVLESAATPCRRVKHGSAKTGLYIYPGYEFKIVNHVITNFHLPGSSLLVMISAFAGREKILAAYREAVAGRYRFFSYGDAMLIL